MKDKKLICGICGTEIPTEGWLLGGFGDWRDGFPNPDRSYECPKCKSLYMPESGVPGDRLRIEGNNMIAIEMVRNDERRKTQIPDFNWI